MGEQCEALGLESRVWTRRDLNERNVTRGSVRRPMISQGSQ